MEVDAIAADADGVRVGFGADLLFEDGEFGFDAAGFADIGGFGETVFGAHNVFAQAEPLKPWSVCIHYRSERLSSLPSFRNWRRWSGGAVERDRRASSRFAAN